MILTQKRTTKLFLLLLALIVALAAFQVGVTYAQADDPDPDAGERQNPLCTDPEAKPHPVLETIAERYGVDYQQLVTWKCEENYGVGEMLVALQTAGLIDEDANALLGKKGKGNAWGKVWKEAGLIGNEADAGPPPWAQNNKEKNNNGNNGNGPPDHANNGGNANDDGEGPGNGNQGGGPPDHANNDKDKPENENKGSDDDDGDDDDAQSLTCESGLVLDGDTVEEANELAEKYDVPAFEIIAQLCGGDSLKDIEGALEGDDD